MAQHSPGAMVLASLFRLDDHSCMVTQKPSMVSVCFGWAHRRQLLELARFLAGGPSSAI